MMEDVFCDGGRVLCPLMDGGRVLRHLQGGYCVFIVTRGPITTLCALARGIAY